MCGGVLERTVFKLQVADSIALNCGKRQAGLYLTGMNSSFGRDPLLELEFKPTEKDVLHEYFFLNFSLKHNPLRRFGCCNGSGLGGFARVRQVVEHAAFF